jgi:hypothetical protein
LIESYVDDVARRLPRKSRNEVGLELRALLADELASVAAQTGRPADSELALQVLAKFGRPEHVAARYGGQRGFNLIEPEHAPAFVKIAALGVAAQWAFTLPRVFDASLTYGEWWLRSGFTALWWVGALVIWFAIGAWIQRRAPLASDSFERPAIHFLFWLPVRQDWQPRPVDHTYAAAKVLVPLAAAVTILFVSPEWWLSRLTGDDASWLRYGDDFGAQLLTPLLVLMSARLVLFTAAAVSLHWRARTELVRAALWIAFVALLFAALVGWDIFASGIVDLLFKIWLSVFLLVNGIQIWLWVRNAVTRVRVPKTLMR